MAEALCREAADHAIVAFVLSNSEPDYPGQFVGRLCINEPTAHVLVAPTLPQLRDLLPGGFSIPPATRATRLPDQSPRSPAK